MPAATSSQTIGPFWHGLAHPEWADLTRHGAEQDHPDRERITFAGTITDGAGQAVTDACVELWQADPPQSPRFPAFGRCATDAEGRFRFTTLRPGPVPAGTENNTMPAGGETNAVQAPHLAITIFARGLLRALTTRAYFDGDPLNAADSLLQSIPDPVCRATLIAPQEGSGAWRLDIRLQGEGETAFLDV